MNSCAHHHRSGKMRHRQEVKKDTHTHKESETGNNDVQVQTTENIIQKQVQTSKYTKPKSKHKKITIKSIQIQRYIKGLLKWSITVSPEGHDRGGIMMEGCDMRKKSHSVWIWISGIRNLISFYFINIFIDASENNELILMKENQDWYWFECVRFRADPNKNLDLEKLNVVS